MMAALRAKPLQRGKYQGKQSYEKPQKLQELASSSRVACSNYVVENVHTESP